MCKNSSVEAQKTGEGSDKPAMVRFFENHFSHIIIQHRVKFLMLFAGVSVFMLIQLPKLEPEQEEPKILPEDSPVQVYSDASSKYLTRGGSDFNTKVSLVFGLNRDPLDRDGTDPTGEGFGAKTTDLGIRGDIKWNPSWTDSQGRTNLEIIRGFDCWIHLCDQAEMRQVHLNTGGAPSYKMEGCLPRTVKEYMKATQPATWQANWNDILAGNYSAFAHQFDLVVEGDPTFASTTVKYSGAEQRPDGVVVWRFFQSVVTLTSDGYINYDKGIELSKAWKSWLDSQMAHSNCAAFPDAWFPLLSSRSFHQFYVTENLMREMTVGIITSLGVALIVLVLVTGNIFVGTYAAFSIAMIVLWVMAMVSLLGWKLGVVENICLVMVPGLAVDYVAHLAEAYNQAKYTDREHRVVHMLEHSGVSVVSGAVSTLIAATCLLFCRIIFFQKFGLFILMCIIFALLFSLVFFPSLLALIGPTGEQGDWHVCCKRSMNGVKNLRVKPQLSKE